jgi:NTP pyrophosphatase (non-canonical NTP hydrolase)
LNIDDYGKFTEEIWFSKHQVDCALFTDPEKGTCDCNIDTERSLTIMSFGLAGETGEVMELLKKRIRDGKFDRDSLIKELGDVAYYWARICQHFNVSPSEVLKINMEKLLDRKARGVMRGSGDNR